MLLNNWRITDFGPQWCKRVYFLFTSVISESSVFSSLCRLQGICVLSGSLLLSVTTEEGSSEYHMPGLVGCNNQIIHSAAQHISARPEQQQLS